MKFDEIQPQPGPSTPVQPDQIVVAARILVADDEPALRNLISSALLQSGYIVDAAEDGAEAWKAIQVKNYDLLITDNNMPKVSGLELLEKLHATAKALPVIMATGVTPEDEFKRRPWLQPSATLIKPFAIAELRETVKRILRESFEPSQRANPYAT